MGIRHCPVKVNAREKFVAHRSISILCRSEEPWTPAHAADKAFDTNTFVMKKKERRKLATSAADHSFNAVCRLTPLTTRRTNKRTNASLPRLPKTRHPIRATNNHPSILRPARWMPQRQSLEQRQQLYLPSNPLWIRCESCKRHNIRLLFSSLLVLRASPFFTNRRDFEGRKSKLFSSLPLLSSLRRCPCVGTSFSLRSTSSIFSSPSRLTIHHVDNI